MKDNHINPNWGILILSVAVIISHIGGDLICSFMTVLYYIVACSSLCLLPTIMGVSYDTDMVKQYFVPLVFTDRTKEEVADLVNTSSFINIPVLLNMICGMYFYYIMENEYLLMSLLLFIFHFRIIYLIIRTTTINYLYSMDEAEDAEY